ncbi:MAG: phosphocholine cytidylyltransferase family protein [Verrucomicrobiota bacterium]|nr:phosphocholine cytidylyltransferase family protein [Verrucomicrobiota bacterium]
MPEPIDHTAILLAAGQGSRVRAHTDEPKILLPLGGRTLLAHHLEAFTVTGLRHVVLVVGYQQELIRAEIARLAPSLEITWVDNADYVAKGNTHSLLLGLRAAPGAVAILDADLVYDALILDRCLRAPAPDAILVGPGSLDDIECAKAIVDDRDCVRKTVDKRALTNEELSQYRFAGEAIGVLKFSAPTRDALLDTTEQFLGDPINLPLNWEHLLNAFLPRHDVACHFESSEDWIEIDTPEDYQSAQSKFPDY